MKFCPQCGKQIADDKRFCPYCRAYMSSARETTPADTGYPRQGSAAGAGPARPEGAVNVPKRSGGVSKWFRCPRCGATFERVGRGGELPQFGVCDSCGFAEGTAERPRGGLRWWHVALPLMLAVLAVVGLFFYRVSQHTVEEAWYNANRALSSVNFFDAKGQITGCEGYSGGEPAYIKEFRSTDACDEIDVLSAEETDGVRRVVCLQVYQRKEDENAFRPDDRFQVFGYDRRGNLIVEQQYYWPGSGEPLLVYSAECELDALGDPVSLTITAGNGDDYIKRTFETHSAFGLCTGADVTETDFGELIYTDGAYGVQAYNTPKEQTFSVKYRY